MGVDPKGKKLIRGRRLKTTRRSVSMQRFREEEDEREQIKKMKKIYALTMLIKINLAQILKNKILL